MPGSPALDTIPGGSCPVNEDQRGIFRPQSTNCDMGAFESQGFTLSISGGDGQSTLTNTVFANPLEVTVSSSVSEPVGPGGVISYTAPIFGAGLTQTVYTATTNGSGAASVVVTANAITGTYQVTATASGITNTVAFSLTNGQSSSGGIYLPIVVKDN